MKKITEKELISFINKEDNNNIHFYGIDFSQYDFSLKKFNDCKFEKCNFIIGLFGYNSGIII